MLTSSASVWPVAAALLFGAVGHVFARETRSGFNVKVRIVGSARVANERKADAHSSGASNDLRLDVPTQAGYFVRFQIVDSAVEQVEIEGVGSSPIEIASGAKDVFVPSSGGEQTLSYRVKVRPGSRLSGAPAVRATVLP